MREAILNLRWHEIMLWGCGFFALLYVGFGLLNELTIRLMPLSRSERIRSGNDSGGRLDPRPHGKGQLRRELGLSAVSVLIFGVGSVVPWGLLQLGWAGLAVDPPWWRIALETVALVAWNEVHFYANHALLHTRALQRFHAPHHHSVVPSPWSTYSFHPLEAVLLGNVLLLPMLLHDFSVQALLFLPIFSILFNNIGHSNYDFLPDADRDRWWLNAARRHHLHHACFRGNYGFMFPFMDRLFGTALPSDAAKAQIDRYLQQRAGHAP